MPNIEEDRMYAYLDGKHTYEKIRIHPLTKLYHEIALEMIAGSYYPNDQKCDFIRGFRETQNVYERN